VSTRKLSLALLRALLRGASAAILLLLALALAPRGTALLARAIERLEPRLEIRWREGNLLEARFERIAWRDGALAVTLHDVAWTLAPRCLLTDALCFDALDVAMLDVDIGPGSGEHTPRALAPVLLPLPLEIGLGTAGALAVRRGDAVLLSLQDIALAGSLRGSRVELARFSARREDLRASLAGHIDLRDRLPLAATGRLARGDTDSAGISFDGDLGRLAFRARSEGRFALDAEGVADLLAQPLAFELQVRSREPLGYPGGAAPGVLHEAQLSARGTTADVHATLAARFESAALGSNALSAEARWTPGRVTLDGFRLNGAAGTLAASGELATTGERRWRVTANATDFCPVGWTPALDCRLSGSLGAEGALVEPAQPLALTATLSGVVNGYDARIDGRVSALPDGRWLVEEARVQSGSNSFTAKGSWGPESHIDASLVVGNLADTIATARGTGRGSFTLRGSPAAPALTASLQMQGVAWGEAAAGTLALQAEWKGAASPANRLRLALTDARWDEFEHASVDATLAGAGAAHRLALSARSAAQALALDCSGGMSAQGDFWKGACGALEIGAPAGASPWRNDRPLELSWLRKDGALRIEPFCLRSDGAALCSGQRARIARDSLAGVSLSGTRIPAAWIGPWLPAGLETSGDLDLRLAAEKPAGGRPRVDGQLDAADLSFTVLAAGESVPLAVERASASLRSRDEGLRLDWRFALVGGATFSGLLDLGDRARGGALEGSMTLEDFDLAPVALHAPGVISAAGTLGGTVRVAGTLRAPRASGSLQLRSGELLHERLPQPLGDIALVLDFAGTEARLAGSFAIDGNTGALEGSARFDDTGWRADIGLRATGLQLEPARGSRLTLSPDLRVRLEPQRAAVDGKVEVAAADIRLDRLPAYAVSVSPDTVIVGAEPPAPPFEYTADVRVELGPAVRVRGKGVDARLDGALQLLRRPGEPLRARGEIRVPEGRYTAYGQELEVTEGVIRFRGPLDRPELRLTAVRRIEDENLEVGVRVRGDLNDPELSAFSRPTMEESRALYYLLTGHAPDPGGNTELAVTGMLLSLGSAGASRITGDVMKHLGIRDFQLDTRQVTGGTEVHLSGYLLPDLYLRYGVSTFDRINTFRLRYRLKDAIHVEAVSGIENAVDFLYSFER